MVGNRQESHIAQLAYDCTAEMQMTESDEDGVGNMITGAPVPTSRMLGGTKLYEAERHIGSKEHMAMSACANPWIDITDKGTAVSPCHACDTEEDHKKREYTLQPFHTKHAPVFSYQT